MAQISYSDNIQIQEKFQYLSDRYQAALTKASAYNSRNSEIQELVRPNAKGFHGGQSSLKNRSAKIHDTTAPWAAEQLASGLHSYLTSPSERFFDISLKGIPYQELGHDISLWLEMVSDRIYHEFNKPTSKFHQAIHETYLDLVGFGIAPLYDYFDPVTQSIKYRSYPVACCSYEENADGEIDTVFRDMEMTARQLMQQFPNADYPEKILKAKPGEDKTYTVTHAVMPSNEHIALFPKNIKLLKPFPFASIYFIEGEKLILAEGGNSVFPYHVPRWVKVAGEVMGESPASTALPDIRDLNLMYQELMISAQMSNRPPLVLDDDGFFLPISYFPGANIFRTPGTPDPVQLPTGGNFNITLEMMMQKRDQIGKLFYTDWLLREKKKERQTTVEIMDDRDEMLRQLSPILGRLENELLSPIIRNAYYYLLRSGQFPDAPDELEGQELDITYISTAAKAQLGVKAAGITQLFQDLAPWVQADPTALDYIKTDVLGAEYTTLRGVTRKVIRSPEEVQQLRAERQKQQQMAEQQVLAQTAGDAAGALKDVAQAQALGAPM